MRKTAIFIFGALILLTAPAFAQDLRISDSDAKKAAIRKPTPEYPAMARQLKLSGTVRVQATVDANGDVEDVKILSGNPVFTKATAETVKKWKFTPFTSGGKVSRAVTDLAFDFR